MDAFWSFARDEPLREPRQHSGWDAILDRKRNVGFAEGNPCTSPQWGHSTFNVFFQPGLAVWVGLDTRMCGGWLLEPARAFHWRKVLLGGPFAAGRPYPPFSLPQRVLALVRLTIADSDRRRSRPRYVIVPFVGNAGHCAELIQKKTEHLFRCQPQCTKLSRLRCCRRDRMPITGFRSSSMMVGSRPTSNVTKAEAERQAARVGESEPVPYRNVRYGPHTRPAKQWLATRGRERKPT